MPVRPKSRPAEKGLSRNGETAEGENEDMAEDGVAQADGGAHLGTASQTEEGQEKGVAESRYERA